MLDVRTRLEALQDTLLTTLQAKAGDVVSGESLTLAEAAAITRQLNKADKAIATALELWWQCRQRSMGMDK